MHHSFKSPLKSPICQLDSLLPLVLPQVVARARLRLFKYVMFEAMKV